MSDQSLNDFMEFDRVVEVRSDGTVTAGPDSVDAPEVSVEVDADGQIIDLAPSAVIVDSREPWELLTGFTGQHSYNGPVMHPSEFVGGGLERHIRSTPGLYTTVVVECRWPEDSGPDDEPAGWAVAHLPPGMY